MNTQRLLYFFWTLLPLKLKRNIIKSIILLLIIGIISFFKTYLLLLPIIGYLLFINLTKNGQDNK